MESARLQSQGSALPWRRCFGAGCAVSLWLLGCQAGLARASLQEDPREAALAETQALIAQRDYAAALAHADAYLDLTTAAKPSADELALAHMLMGEVQLGL
ncbi:MAG TPA: hypothetical protein VLT59_13080, partial [Steroidobacteraceae bacterium]|nr:hypothetical protein [Steroidobacteraceae bacterium]